ncbi:MAG: hypothetical protein EOO91_09510 [Pedobacter sp.]|nr:MAG: hypothetical protein EOO91_09510 [Pedobacter sp.]
MKFSEDLQKLIPFGYLFLVVMGILKESVIFYQLGINILKYSTLMDILISPIATLTTHPITFKYNHTLNFSNGGTEQISLINTNTVYYFYVSKGSKTIKIAPIGAIKNIELTNNRMFKNE